MKKRELEITMASELIKQLQEYIDQHGDMPVTCLETENFTGYTSNVFVECQPYYYDGGWTFQIWDGENHRWYNSRDKKDIRKDIKKHPHVLKIKSAYPCEFDDYYNDKQITEAWHDEGHIDQEEYELLKKQDEEEKEELRKIKESEILKKLKKFMENHK